MFFFEHAQLPRPIKKSASAANECVHSECLPQTLGQHPPPRRVTPAYPARFLSIETFSCDCESFKGAPCRSLTPPFSVPIGPFLSLGEEPGSRTVSSFCVTGALSYIISTQSRYLSTPSAAPQVCLCLCNDGEA